MENKLVIIEDFISKESCDFIIKNFRDRFRETPNVGIYGGPNQGIDRAWYVGNKNPVSHYSEVYDENVAVDLLTGICNNVVRTMSQYYNVELDPRSIFYSKMTKGSMLNEHYDNFEPDGQIAIPLGSDESIINELGFEVDYSGLLYLNDDYQGGEIVFPKQEISMKPKPGTLIFFMGDMEFPHSVNEIIDGERLNVVSFYWPAAYRKKYIEILNSRES